MRAEATATVEAIDPVGDTDWDRFVEGHDRATVYHLSAWSRILERCFGCEPRYIAARHPDGTLVGILPLVYRRRLRNAYVGSLPFVRQAGPLAQTTGQEMLLVRTALALARGEGAQLSIRTPVLGLENEIADLSALPEEPSNVLSLKPGASAMLHALPGSLRRDVARGMRSVEVREASSESDLRRFYRLYLATMRRLGAAPRPWLQMQLCWEALRPRGHLRLLVAEHQRRVVAAGIFHVLGTRVEARYMADDVRSRSLRATHAVYWTMIERAATEGYRTFDFGGGSGSLAWFKRRWGAVPVPLNRYVDLAAGSQRRPDPPVSPAPDARVEDPPRAKFWRRLPLALSPLAGRVVYRYRL